MCMQSALKTVKCYMSIVSELSQKHNVPDVQIEETVTPM